MVFIILFVLKAHKLLTYTFASNGFTYSKRDIWRVPLVTEFRSDVRLFRRQENTVAYALSRADFSGYSVDWLVIIFSEPCCGFLLYA